MKTKIISILMCLVLLGCEQKPKPGDIICNKAGEFGYINRNGFPVVNKLDLDKNYPYSIIIFTNRNQAIEERDKEFNHIFHVCKEK